MQTLIIGSQWRDLLFKMPPCKNHRHKPCKNVTTEIYPQAFVYIEKSRQKKEGKEALRLELTVGVVARRPTSTSMWEVT